MKRKLLLCALLGTTLTLSGCASLLDKISGGELIKKLDVLNLISDEPETTNQTGGSNNNNSSNTGGQTQTGSLLDTLKSMAKSIAAKMLGKSESSITFADYESDDMDSDVYYYDSSTLTFVDIEGYEESFGESFVNRLKTYIPSTATLANNLDDTEYQDLGYIYYDRYYIDGEFTYNIWAESSDVYDDGSESYPAESYGAIMIYKTSQQSAFDSYFADSE